MVNTESRPEGFSSRVPRWVLWGFLAVAAFYLMSEHRLHLAPVAWISVAFLLLCPFLHMGMHGGHGGHGGRGRARNQPSALPDDRQGTPGAPVIPASHVHAARARQEH